MTPKCHSRAFEEKLEDKVVEAALDSKSPIKALVSLLVQSKNAETNAGDAGHFCDEGGWQQIVDDTDRVIEMIREREQLGLPLVLVGHSMGSGVARHYITQNGEQLVGCVVMGSGATLGPSEPSAAVSALIAKDGPQSRLPMGALFGALDDAVVAAAGGAKETAGHDWLSRRPEVGAAYEADGRCCVVQ